jgi:hypothetical protein
MNDQPDDVFTAAFDLAYKHLTGRDPHARPLDYDTHKRQAWHGWQLAAGAGDSGAWRAWYEAAMTASNAAGFVGFDPAQTIQALDDECERLRRQVGDLIAIIKRQL